MQLELLKQIVAELSEKLANARIDKIFQPAADILLFRLWDGRVNRQLLISAKANEGRIHLTTIKYPNPFTPPRFCQLLRSRIGRILNIELLNDDRIVSLQCSGPKGESTLIVELTGARCNMILLDFDQRIIDSLHRINPGEGGRQLVNGKLYELPAKSLNRWEQEYLEPNSADRLSACEFVDKLYNSGNGNEKGSDLRSVLLAEVAKQRKKLGRRLENIRKEQGRQENAEEFKQIGELLLANFQQLKKGMKEIALVDLYAQSPKEVVVSLKGHLNPQENAEYYFKRYKKAQRGVAHSARRYLETQQELEWLDSVTFQLHESVSAQEIEEIAAECKRNGLLQNKKDRFGKKRIESGLKLQETTSPNGFKIIWGKNNRQNDYLTSRIMKPKDLWFHVHQGPGAHVLLKGDGSMTGIKEEDLTRAAAIAAGYSKIRENSKVEVIMAEPKNVHKPKGAKPGLVSVKEYKTLMVEPLRLS